MGALKFINRQVECGGVKCGGEGSTGSGIIQEPIRVDPLSVIPSNVDPVGCLRVLWLPPKAKLIHYGIPSHAGSC